MCVGKPDKEDASKGNLLGKSNGQTLPSFAAEPDKEDASNGNLLAKSNGQTFGNRIFIHRYRFP